MKLRKLLEMDTWASVPKYTGPVDLIPIQEIDSNLSGWNQILIINLEKESSEQNYLNNLTQSIKRFGIKRPLEISTNNGWTIEEGNHRFIVAKRLGLDKVPVLFV